MIPLSLYIHFPWCVKKCPYCDFNSHALKGELPEQEYINALLLNLEHTLDYAQGRSIISIFMGGGTPSLFSPASIKTLLQAIQKRIAFAPNIEITLEANPGTVDLNRLILYRECGINRISLGVQSFSDIQLPVLGRIHNAQTALDAIEMIKTAGFTDFNIDLMYGLPNQSIQEGLADLKTGIAQNPTHLSWYELTLEPHTYFWHHPPPLPQSDLIGELMEEGQVLLAESGFAQYEISAYQKTKPCLHNINYWEFGDYLAIGAGSHGKITDLNNKSIIRYHHIRNPKRYMESTENFVEDKTVLAPKQQGFELLLNGLRLKEGIPFSYIANRTDLQYSDIAKPIAKAVSKNLLVESNNQLQATALGYRFLNDLTSLFLPENEI